jgi:hypothetical protein
MQRRDGWEGWSRNYEAAYERIFRGDPTPEDVAEATHNDPQVVGAPDGWEAEWVGGPGAWTLRCRELATGWSCVVPEGGLLPWAPEFRRRSAPLAHETVHGLITRAVADETLRRQA